MNVKKLKLELVKSAKMIWKKRIVMLKCWKMVEIEPQ
jgi:hypothetical protein